MMNLGENIQYLRKINKITQEELADQMSVSRQTISKWEMNQAFPEIPKIVELADVFHCKVDELLRVNLAERMNVYSDVKVTKVPGFTMGRYVIISPNPEDDVHAYMEAWAQRSGLLSVTDGKPACIGWDFPFVSAQTAEPLWFKRLCISIHPSRWFCTIMPWCGNCQSERNRICIHYHS